MEPELLEASTQTEESGQYDFGTRDVGKIYPERAGVNRDFYSDRRMRSIRFCRKKQLLQLIAKMRQQEKDGASSVATKCLDVIAQKRENRYPELASMLTPLSRATYNKPRRILEWRVEQEV